MNQQTNVFAEEFNKLFGQPNMLRSVLILIASMLVAYLLSKFLANGIVRLAQLVATRGDKETNDQKNLRYRQIETYLSITVAVIRVLVVAVVGYVAWLALSPFAAENNATNGFAAIGAGTLFIVFAGQTLGIILRDITTGAIMITEGWFHVGDYVKLEPYWELAGVVERFTLRSTRLRALNGEVIWVNNQNITGARVTPRGVRTLSVEIFIKDKEQGLSAIQSIINTMPKGKTMLSQPLTITEVEEWNGDSWHVSVTGQTPPGREWLINEYFIAAINALDADKSADEEKLLALPALVHMADMTADKRFRRAVRVAQPK